MNFEKIIIHKHAQERMQERGATEEVIQTLKEGEKFPAKFGRIGFRRNFSLREFGEAKSIKQSKLKFMEL